MLKKKYYCLVAGLPDLFFNENKLIFNRLNFRNELQILLSTRDFKLVESLFLPYDNLNLLQFLFHQETTFHPLGLISQSEFEFQLSAENEKRSLPQYMIKFLDDLKEKEIKEYTLEVENTLHQYFYEYALGQNNKFLHSWLYFEINLKNILTAFNCVHFGYPLSKHLIKVEQNVLPYSLLLKKQFKAELFEDVLPYCHQIFKIAESDLSLIEKEKALDQIKWEYLDQYTFFHYFTIEKILAYFIKLQITERWMKLDKEKGKILLNKLMVDLQTSTKFSEEFSITP